MTILSTGTAKALLRSLVASGVVETWFGMLRRRNTARPQSLSPVAIFDAASIDVTPRPSLSVGL